MNIEETLDALLKWRKGAVIQLGKVTGLEIEVKELKRRLNALESTNAAVGPKPPKAERLSFGAICEDLETRFYKVFDVPGPGITGEEWTVSAIAARLKVKYNSKQVGRFLSLVGAGQKTKRVRGKLTRVYLLVSK